MVGFFKATAYDFKMKKIIPLFCLSIVIIFLGLFPCIKVVSISNRKNFSESIYSSKALNGFVISYTHSVNKGRIHDYYECENNQFVLKKSVFVSYGAGITEPEEINGCDFEVTENGYILSNMNIRPNPFLLAVGVIAEHSITIEENEYFLKDFFPVRTGLIFKIKKVSVLNYIKNNNFNKSKK